MRSSWILPFLASASLMWFGCGDDDGVSDGGGDDAAADATTEDAPAEDAVTEDAVGGCLENAECEAGEYCAADTCDGAGECEIRPEDCPTVEMPVCGCDGETYSNSCVAAAAGMRVASEGECPCMENTDCEEAEYCMKTACGEATGECVTRPTGCDDVGTGACGCDGMTYVNECVLGNQGINLASLGECPCMENTDCAETEYCMKAMCGDELGECVSRPNRCDDVGTGACGCDGETYVNLCTLARAGINLASEGECPCMENTDCRDGMFCEKEGCDDEFGMCSVQPNRCDDVGTGVCSCTMTTYVNMCAAHMAGENIASDGACP